MDHHASARIEAAARALASDLESTIPVAFEGDEDWHAVAERALAAGDAVSRGEGPAELGQGPQASAGLRPVEGWGRASPAESRLAGLRRAQSLV
jgi:hypothetical protein